MNVVFIGSGNLATQLALAFQAKGINICQIYNRTLSNAKELGEKLNVPYTSDLDKLEKDADFYFYAVKDSALKGVLKKVQKPDAIHVHTSGTTPISVFDGLATRYAVFYPLQTFSKDKAVDFSIIPVFIEASHIEIQRELTELAKMVTTKIYNVNSEQRKKLHLAAVFACNFTNYMYDMAFETLRNSGIGFELLHPLIAETADKVKYMTPKDAQTGPAVRYDVNIINKHLDSLKRKPHMRYIYKDLSKAIYERHKKAKTNRNLTLNRLMDKVIRGVLGIIYPKKRRTRR